MAADSATPTLAAQHRGARAREHARPLSVDDARAHVVAGALADAPVGLVGLELEGHLVDLDRPAERVPWSRVLDAARHVPPLPGGSRLTVEPGGQLELSGPPGRDAGAAVTAMRQDEAVLRTSLAADRLRWGP